MDEPDKPKGMHWATYNRLLEQADEVTLLNTTAHVQCPHLTHLPQRFDREGGKILRRDGPTAAAGAH